MPKYITAFFPPARNGSVLWGLCLSEAEAPFSVLGGRNVSRVFAGAMRMGSAHQAGGCDRLGGTGDRAGGGSPPRVWVFGGAGCGWKPQQISRAGYEMFMGKVPGLPVCPGHSWAAEAVLVSPSTCGGCHLCPEWLFCMWDCALPVCLWHGVVSGWSLRSRSIIYLSSFWANGHLCSLCSTSYSLQPAFLYWGHPLQGFCADLGPPFRCS